MEHSVLTQHVFHARITHQDPHLRPHLHQDYLHYTLEKRECVTIPMPRLLIKMYVGVMSSDEPRLEL